MACAGALLAVGAGGDAQALPLADGPVRATGAPLTGTWLLVDRTTGWRGRPRDANDSTLPQGVLTVDADGYYLMLLACGQRALGVACRVASRGTDVYRGQLHSNGSAIDFRVDRSTTRLLQGAVLHTAYGLDGDQLTLTFDARPPDTSAGLQGPWVWQRVADGPESTVSADARPGSCGPHPTTVPDLDRSTLYEARVDQ